MNSLEHLLARSQSQCELCSSQQDLSSYSVPGAPVGALEHSILVCGTCFNQINHTETLNPRHWHCLKETMWTQVPAVQVMIWSILTQLSSESWAQDLLEQLYLDEETLNWAKQSLKSNLPEVADSSTPLTRDSFGNPLSNGDSVTLIKDLDVKGARFTAKRGTVVKNISLTSHPEQIEGKINGTQIVLLTQYLKKN
jgi:protein PhnA